VARTDADSAMLLTSDVDERDHEFIDRQAGRTLEGFHRLKPGSGLQHCIKRGIAFAPYSDLLWMETSTPDLVVAKQFAEAVKKEVPSAVFAYNCSPSFNWTQHMTPEQAENFQKELGAMGYKFQFITLAGYHLNNYAAFELAHEYKFRGMAAYRELQAKEFAAQKIGYSAVKHQREVGTGYFDKLANTIMGGAASTTALEGSTEAAQFEAAKEEGRAFEGAKHIFQLTMEEKKGDDQILTEDALVFLGELHERFEGRRKELLEKRKARQQRIDAGTEFPDFQEATQNIRDADWSVGEVPKDLQDRRVEITGPVSDRKMVINALNSGASCFMADFEDSNCPTWKNQIEGQKNLYDAVRRQIQYKDVETKKFYQLVDNPAVLMVRPRGWHLTEKHLLVDDVPISGSLFDVGLYLFHNAAELVRRGTGAYLYLPKLQNAEEAALWNDVFNFSREYLKLSSGSIKVTVLIEHILATFEMDEILLALSDYIAGLNCGRWDYIFSYIKTFRNFPKYVLPDRTQIGMTTPFMRAYALKTIKTCHNRRAHAIGGMAAQIPIKGDEAANQHALSLVRQDKEREVHDGHDGTWVAHPGLVPIAMEIFNAHMPAPNQVSKLLSDFHASASDLTAIPQGTRTEKGLRHNVNVNLGYMEAWLRGTGCVPLYNLMEDAATAEISRSQLWQWIHHEAKLVDGRKIDMPLVDQIIEEETNKWIEQFGKMANRVNLAARLLSKLNHEETMSDFLTIAAYDKLVSEGK